MRASDRRREWTVARLRGAYVDGALSTETFEIRTGQAYRSRTREQLSSLLDDLSSPWQHLWQRSRAWLRSFLAMPVAVGVADARLVALPMKPGERIVVGRDHACDVVVDDPAVSRRHVSIRCLGKEWEARDLDSTNGTYVDGRRVSAAHAYPGDVLYLGASTAVRLVRPA
jgi:hypothetical protein